MNFRQLFSSNKSQAQRRSLRNSGSDVNYLSTQIMHPHQNNSNNDNNNQRQQQQQQRTSISSTTFQQSNINDVRALNAYFISSDFSTTSTCNSPSNKNQNNAQLSTNSRTITNPYQSHINQVPNINLPDSNVNSNSMHHLHHASSAPYIATLNNSHNTCNINGYNKIIFDIDIDEGSPITIDDDDDDDDEDDSLSGSSYLDDELMEDVCIESSSPASKSIFTNTPSVIPLVNAFHGITFSDLLIKPCGQRFDIGVTFLTLSQILNYLLLKLFYPFAGFIYPLLNITFMSYIFFISFSNLSILLLFLIQPIFEYFYTNYVLFLFQLLLNISQIFFIFYSDYFPILLLSRLLFIFCLNFLWVHSNGAIRSCKRKFNSNKIAQSRRNLLLHSSWQISTFLLCILSYFWYKFDLQFNIILICLFLPTFLFSIFYLIFLPSSTMRIKYIDESYLNIIHRTWLFIANDLGNILRESISINCLIFVNILSGINSIMILFIFGIWLQKLLNLNIFQLGLYTLIQGISELCVMFQCQYLNKYINRRKLSIISIFISIIFLILFYISVYLTFNICNDTNNNWYCLWFSILYENGNGVNNWILITGLFGIFCGHETFTATLMSFLFRECRKHNTPNAAYALWNIVTSFSTFCGQLIVGLLWIYFNKIHSMLLILPLMFIIDIVVLCGLIYLLKMYKK